jgi:hypothetical protein
MTEADVETLLLAFLRTIAEEEQDLKQAATKPTEAVE